MSPGPRPILVAAVRALAITLGITASPTLAGAHDSTSPLEVAVTLAPRQVIAQARWIVTGVEAEALMEQIDRDQSGDLSPAERATLADYLASRCAQSIRIHLAGRPIALARRTAPTVQADAAGVRVEVTLLGRTEAGGVADLVVAVDTGDPRHVTPVSVRALTAPPLPGAGLVTAVREHGQRLAASLARATLHAARQLGSRTRQSTPCGVSSTSTPMACN
jgi:hypothetical protein